MKCSNSPHSPGVSTRFSRTLIVSGSRILRCIFAVLRDGTPYRDPATDYEELLVKRNAPRWLRKLREFGILVHNDDGRRLRALAATREDDPGALRTIRAANALTRRSDSTTGTWGSLAGRDAFTVQGAIAVSVAAFRRGGIRTPGSRRCFTVNPLHSPRSTVSLPPDEA